MDAQTTRRDSVALRAQSSRNRWLARKERQRARRAVARAREVCYEPLIWLGSDELEELTGAEPSILRLVLPEAEEPRPA